jgi:hypothetical protein
VALVGTPKWEVALPTVELDPARFLGEFSALPPVPQPGDWCTIVWAADDGEIPLTLVAREPARMTSIFVDRRRTNSDPLGNALAPRDAATRNESALPSGRD